MSNRKNGTDEAAQSSNRCNKNTLPECILTPYRPCNYNRRELCHVTIRIIIGNNKETIQLQQLTHNSCRCTRNACVLSPVLWMTMYLDCTEISWLGDETHSLSSFHQKNKNIFSSSTIFPFLHHFLGDGVLTSPAPVGEFSRSLPLLLPFLPSWKIETWAVTNCQSKIEEDFL